MSLQSLMDRAVGLHGQARLEEAERLYLQILSADSRHIQAGHMLGVIRAQQGRNAEAAELIAATVKAEPGDAVAWANLGNVLNALSRHDAALDAFNRAVALHPANADAWNNRGIALQRLNRLDEARESYDWALRAQPGHALAHNNRASLLQGQCDYAAALAGFDAALTLAPDYAAAHSNRGNVLQILTRYAEAVASFDRALALDPGYAAAWSNRGLALQNLGRIDDAKSSFRRAIALKPQMAEAHLNLGLCHLLMGEWREGWPLYEWRKRMPEPMEARDYPSPLWTGAEDIKGKTLFLYIEQGLGDTIQFYRYVEALLAKGARVILSVPGQLTRLLSSAAPKVELIAWGQAPAGFDYHIPLASLPLALGMTVATIPAPARYLQAEPDRAAAWKKKLGRKGFRIGIAWQGNETILGSEGKSFPVASLSGIAALPGVRLIALQKNAGSEQLRALPPGMTVEEYEFDTGADAFLDTAAMMENCDLVISADTAPAHLAGALGVPAWVALKYVPDWRWFLGRSDSPWYPAMRLFRQAAPGDWAGVFTAMAADLPR